jgi:hypothetical protein
VHVARDLHEVRLLVAEHVATAPCRE